MGKRLVTYDEWCEMTEEEQSHVTVLSFTGLTSCDTLKEQPTRSEDQSTLGSGGRED